MKWIGLLSCACAMLMPGPATAALAPLAFDDQFTGDALRQHWDFFSEGSGWEYLVQGGRLRVSRLFGPFGHNEVAIVARTRDVGDFVISARLGWDLGQYQTVKLGVSGDYPFFAPRIATVAYVKSPGSEGRIDAFINGGGTASVLAPPAGEHTFTIRRRGTILTILLNRQLVHSSAFGSQDPGRYVWLEFHGPDSPEFGHLTADFVRVQYVPYYRGP